MNSALFHNGDRQPDGSVVFGTDFSLQGTNRTKLTVMAHIGPTVHSP